MKKGYSVTRDFSWIENCKLNGNSVVQNHSGGSNSNTINSRSSHRSCSVRKSVLRNFAKFTGKYLCQVLFYNKVACPEPATLSKKRLQHRYFPLNFARFPRTPFHRTPLNDCFSTMQHFLAENPSKVLNGQQQHKGVTFR